MGVTFIGFTGKNTRIVSLFALDPFSQQVFNAKRIANQSTIGSINPFESQVFNAKSTQNLVSLQALAP